MIPRIQSNPLRASSRFALDFVDPTAHGDGDDDDDDVDDDDDDDDDARAERARVREHARCARSCECRCVTTLDDDATTTDETSRGMMTMTLGARVTMERRANERLTCACAMTDGQ